MIKKLFQTMLIVGIFALSLACATKRPVLSPNTHLESVGMDIAQQDIDDCLRGVRQGSYQPGKVAGSTAMGAATGAAVGAASGAIFGSAGRGAAAGAAGGAAGGLLQGLLYSRGRDLTFQQRQLVEQCLRDKGYEITGWE